MLTQPYKTAVKIIWSDSNLWLRAHPWLEERPPLVVEHFSPFNESAMTQLLRGTEMPRFYLFIMGRNLYHSSFTQNIRPRKNGSTFLSLSSSFNAKIDASEENGIRKKWAEAACLLLF